MRMTRSRLLDYMAAVVAVTLALSLTLLLKPWLEYSVFAFFLPAVMVSAWHGGLWPGLLSTLLSTLAIDIYLLPPPRVVTMGWEDIPRMIVFVLMAVMISSLTEARRRSAKKLRALAEELKQSDELKGALLASVSHDLRTPLTSIRAATDSLLNQKFDWDEATKREFHQIISEEVNRLMRLIENLLAMARIEAGELGLSKQWGSIAEICSNALDQCAPELQRNRMRIECPEELPLIKADHRIIAEALTHLVENAVKYSPTESEIMVRASFKDGEVSFSVEDKGPGVAPEESERIFEKFYRSASLDGRYTDGTGMGLAITRGLIEAHGGRIWVESEPGQGATFTMALQVEHKQATRAKMADDEL